MNNHGVIQRSIAIIFLPRLFFVAPIPQGLSSFYFSRDMTAPMVSWQIECYEVKIVVKPGDSVSTIAGPWRYVLERDICLLTC